MDLAFKASAWSRVEYEKETLTRSATMSSTKTAFERAMTLAAVSGMRATLGPALLAASRRTPHARHWALAAMGEMILDKIGVLPARFRPSLMIPHAIAGGWVAHESLKEDGVEDTTAAVVGAVVAAGVASVAPIARIALNRGLGVSDALLGLAEHYLALRLGTEATELSMNQVAEVAKDAVAELGETVAPVLPSLPKLHSTAEAV